MSDVCESRSIVAGKRFFCRRFLNEWDRRNPGRFSEIWIRLRQSGRAENTDAEVARWLSALPELNRRRLVMLPFTVSGFRVDRYPELINEANTGAFSWHNGLELADIMAGITRVVHEGSPRYICSLLVYTALLAGDADGLDRKASVRRICEYCGIDESAVFALNSEMRSAHENIGSRETIRQILIQAREIRADRRAQENGINQAVLR